MRARRYSVCAWLVLRVRRAFRSLVVSSVRFAFDRGVTGHAVSNHLFFLRMHVEMREALDMAMFLMRVFVSVHMRYSHGRTWHV